MTAVDEGTLRHKTLHDRRQGRTDTTPPHTPPTHTEIIHTVTAQHMFKLLPGGSPSDRFGQAVRRPERPSEDAEARQSES